MVRLRGHTSTFECWLIIDARKTFGRLGGAHVVRCAYSTAPRQYAIDSAPMTWSVSA
jgi:hypothetical protein